MGNRKREVEVVDDQTLHCCCICLSANISRIPQPHILCVRNRLASAFQFCWLVLLALRGRSHLHFCFLWSKTEWEKITVLYFCVWPIRGSHCEPALDSQHCTRSEDFQAVAWFLWQFSQIHFCSHSWQIFVFEGHFLQCTSS